MSLNRGDYPNPGSIEDRIVKELLIIQKLTTAITNKDKYILNTIKICKLSKNYKKNNLNKRNSLLSNFH